MLSGNILIVAICGLLLAASVSGGGAPAAPPGPAPSGGKASQQGPPASFAGFLIPHRIFRWAWFVYAGECARADWQDAVDVGTLVTQARMLTAAYKSHNLLEQKLFKPILEPLETIKFDEWADEHQFYLKKLEIIRNNIEHIQAETNTAQRALDGANYTSYIHEFISGDLMHMDWEETEGKFVFLQYFSLQDLAKFGTQLIQDTIDHFGKPDYDSGLTPFAAQIGDSTMIVYLASVVDQETAGDDKAWKAFCATVKKNMSDRNFGKALAMYPHLSGNRSAKKTDL